MNLYDKTRLYTWFSEHHNILHDRIGAAKKASEDLGLNVSPGNVAYYTRIAPNYVKPAKKIIPPQSYKSDVRLRAEEWLKDKWWIAQTTKSLHEKFVKETGVDIAYHMFGRARRALGYNSEGASSFRFVQGSSDALEAITRDLSKVLDFLVKVEERLEKIEKAWQ